MFVLIPNERNNLHFIVDIAGLVLLFLLIAAYFLFGANFAELHIFLFRAFPVFVGEIALAICFVLFTFRYLVSGSRVQKSSLWIWIFYGFWILVKAMSGYIDNGGYALRNAALFYYPFTAYFAYVFFQGLFIRRNGHAKVLSEPDFSVFFFGIGMCVALGQAAIVMEPFGRYCLLAVLAGVFISFDRPWLKLLGLLSVFSGGVMAGLLDCSSRTHFLSLFITGNFLLVFFFSIWKVQKRFKWTIGILFCALLLALIVTRSDPNTVKSLVTPKFLQKALQESEERLKKEGPYYVFQPKEVQIYNPNPPDFSFISKWVVIALTSVKGEHPSPALEKAPSVLVPLPMKNSELSEENRAVSVTENTASALYPTLKSPGMGAAPVKGVSGYLSVQDSNSLSKESVSVSDRAPKSHGMATTPAKVVSGPPLVLGSNGLSKKPVNVSDPTPKSPGITLASGNAVSSNLPEEAVGSNVGKSIRMKYSTKAEPRSLGTAYNNILFRYFIWRDMVEEFLRERPVLFGFSFGRPQRSRSLEILGWAWGEWSRDGWIAPHNSFLHLIYRGGLVGLGVIIVTIMLLARMMLMFVLARSSMGACLVSALVFGMVAANFSVFLELPYTAIPFWFLFGLTWAYARIVKKGSVQKSG